MNFSQPEHSPEAMTAFASQGVHTGIVTQRWEQPIAMDEPTFLEAAHALIKELAITEEQKVKIDPVLWDIERRIYRLQQKK